MDGGATEVLAATTVFAIVLTKVVDLIRNVVGQILKEEEQKQVPKWTWNVAALGLGVAMALAWQINLLDNYSDPDSVVQGFFGQILTGLAMGGAASGYHELFDTLSSTAKRARYGPEPRDRSQTGT